MSASGYSELFNGGNISHYLERLPYTMQLSGSKIFRTLSHDCYSFDEGGIKETVV
jgi:hypothetical protein